MELTKKQKIEWGNWLNDRPKNVREVADKIVPWKKYRNTRIAGDIGNRYSPVSYEEEEDGSVTVTCEKSNEEMPFLGGYRVFGMKPEYLEEAN